MGVSAALWTGAVHELRGDAVSFGKRVDGTHGAIRDGLREQGIVVYDTSGSAHTKGGRGGPDLVCFCRVRGWLPLWVKRPKGAHTASEKKADAAGIPLVYVESLAEAYGLFGIYTALPDAGEPARIYTP